MSVRALATALVFALSVTGCSGRATVAPSPLAIQSTPAESGQTSTTFSAPTLSDAPITVQAHWEPLEGADMENLATLPEVGELFRDLSPEEPEKVYPSSFFVPLLPDSPVAVGETWALDLEFVETLLSQFSPTVRGEMNFDGSGAFATLRARTDNYWEIAVRMHAQFAYPGEVYLSPSSFEGRVVIDLRGQKLQYLSLFVPHDHERNVAFEVHSGEFLTGLGSAPRMELSGGSKAQYDWTEEIPEEQARELLARQFFPFEKLDWLPLDEALERAAKDKSPLFLVVIEGALTDQSC